MGAGGGGGDLCLKLRQNEFSVKYEAARISMWCPLHIDLLIFIP